MIKNVLFDLDDTLLDFGKAEKNALTLAFTEKGINPTEELLSRYSVINEEHWKRLEKEEITRDEVKYGRFSQLFDEYGINVSPVETADIYEKYLGMGHYFIDGAKELLSSLYGKYRLYLVSTERIRCRRAELQARDLKSILTAFSFRKKWDVKNRKKLSLKRVLQPFPLFPGMRP